MTRDWAMHRAETCTRKTHSHRWRPYMLENRVDVRARAVTRCWLSRAGRPRHTIQRSPGFFSGGFGLYMSVLGGGVFDCRVDLATKQE